MQEVHSFKKVNKIWSVQIKRWEKQIFCKIVNQVLYNISHTTDNKPPLPDCNYINYSISITVTDYRYLFHN